MQFWDCEACGCQAIAGSLNDCPQCGRPKSVPGEALQSDASDAPQGAEPAAPQAPPVEDVHLPENDGWGEPDGKN